MVLVNASKLWIHLEVQDVAFTHAAPQVSVFVLLY
jgi:hypothetical protein